MADCLLSLIYRVHNAAVMVRFVTLYLYDVRLQEHSGVGVVVDAVRGGLLCHGAH